MRYLWIAVFGVVLVWSVIAPKEYSTWAMEVAPALIVVMILAFTRRRFPLTPLAYGLILAHAVILMVGGHYTYAEVPLFNWLRDAMHGTRNNYDKIGHLAQGFVPALVAREVFIRLGVVNGRYWRTFLVLCLVLGVSACYEFIEWWAALLLGGGADAFLGMQGDNWDTQSDMFCALIGGILALSILGGVHDRQLARFTTARGPDGTA